MSSTEVKIIDVFELSITGDAGRRRHWGRVQGRRQRIESVAYRTHILGEWRPESGCLFAIVYDRKGASFGVSAERDSFGSCRNLSAFVIILAERDFQPKGIILDKRGILRPKLGAKRVYMLAEMTLFRPKLIPFGRKCLFRSIRLSAEISSHKKRCIGQLYAVFQGRL